MLLGEKEYTPTRVVLIRNLPIDVTEKDLTLVSEKFGTVVKVFMLM